MFGYKYYRFSLALSKDDLLSIYQGVIKKVRVRTDKGLVLELDANHLKKFTTQEGISGNFELATTQDNKFVEIKKI